MENSRRFFRLILIFLLVWNLSALFAQTTIEEDGSILLPAQKNLVPGINTDKQLELSLTSEWTDFTRRSGSWAVIWNEATRTPHRAYGQATQIPGYSRITEENVADAAMTFLIKNASLLRINPEELKLRRATEVNNRWYVSYVQIKDGIEVLFSEVELRIFSNGKIMAWGADVYPVLNISTTPTISYRTAQENALRGLDFKKPTDRVYGDGKLFILPVRKGEEITYHLVYEVFVEIRDLIENYITGNYIVFVDAHDGQIIWRHNQVRDQNISGKVTGMVQLVLPTDPFVEEPFPNQYLTIDGTQLATDSLGEFIYNLSASATLSTGLTGPWVMVLRDDGYPNASQSLTVNPGDTVNLMWDFANSHPAERDAFYHVNRIHDFITHLDPNFTFLNYSMPCKVNINDFCNAFWDGNGINFYREGGGCPNMAQSPSVIYHEYGHGINDKLYRQLGSPVGMINGATHEGLADVSSAMMEDDPRIGRGFFGPGSVLRYLNNTNKYPDDISGEPHHDGLIIAGAFWDLRVATSLETFRYLSHFAKYGLPDDLDTGIAFSEWYLEVLIADDDDGDLSNGTPHFTEINNAFSAHGIGSSLFLTFSFSHTPLPDTQDTLNVYPAQITIGVSGLEVDSVRLHFTTDNFQSIQSVPAVATGQNQFQANIPPQSAGCIVKYYFTAFDPLESVHITLPPGAPFNDSYQFLVGFQTELLDEMEVESGWLVGAPDDNATTGIWERGDPEYSDLSMFGLPSFITQPENDHTPNGQYCYVTGAATFGNPVFNMVNGKTTLFSPVFDLSAMNNPVIQYYRWFSTISGLSGGNGSWMVDISNNNGQTWVQVENTQNGTNSWERIRFRVADYVLPSDSIVMRFVAINYYPTNSLVEGLVDDFEIFGSTVGTTVVTNQTGWPQPSTGEIMSGNAIVDIDGDGNKEIVTTSMNNKIYVWNSDGTLQPGFPVSTQIGIVSTPAIGDIDNNGDLEIVVTGMNGHLYVINHDASILTDVNIGTGINGTPSLFDLDSNGNLEIIFGTNSGKVYVLNANGTNWGSFPLDFGIYHSISGGIAIGDVNGDQVSDLVFGTYNGDVFAISSVTADTLPGFPVNVGQQVSGAPVIVDFDGAGAQSAQIVVGSRAQNIAVINGDGSIAGNYLFDGQIEGTPAIADLNGDGLAEIIFGTRAKRIYAIAQNGALLSGFPVITSGEIRGSLVVADLDNNGNPDIIVVSGDGKLYAVTGNGSGLGGFPVGVGASPFSTPTVADLDGDGDLEIAVGGTDAMLVVDVKKPGSNNGYWFTHQGNYHRTSNYQHMVVGIDEPLADNLPHRFELLQNYPNPFNPTTNIGFRISDFGFVSLKIYDITGREVATLISEKLAAGKYEYQWDASGLASGVYFCKLTTGKFTDTRKLILLK